LVHEHQLKYTPTVIDVDNKTRKRKRKVIYFNPPYNSNVKTNIGAKFLQLVRKHFQNTSLAKIFNKNTVKVSYRCTPNIKSIISGHNKKVLNNRNNRQSAPPKMCHCTIRECPLNGECQLDSLVYQATVTDDQNSSETYVGICKPTFYERHQNHLTSFRHKSHQKKTELSKHIWKLKRNNQDYSIKWRLLNQSKLFCPVSGVCQLCTDEKYYIIYNPELATLNKREELGNKCRHMEGFLLDKT